MKKLFYLFLLILLFVPISIYAVEITVDNNSTMSSNSAFKEVTNEGTISITGVNSGDTLSVYKIVNIYYGLNTIEYDFTEEFKDYLLHSLEYGENDYSGLTIDDYKALSSGDIDTGTTSNTSELGEVVSGFSSYIKKNKIVGTIMDTSGNTASTSLPVGAYFIKPVMSTKIYSPMVGNITLESNNGDWNVVSQTIVAKYTDTDMNSTIVDNKEHVDPSITGSSSYSYNEPFTNNIDIPLPSYPSNATNDTFELDLFEISFVENENFNLDILDSLTISDGTSTITVKDDTNLVNQDNEVVGSISKSESTDEDSVTTVYYTVRLDLTKLNGNSLDVKYDTLLTENAIIGSTGNSITNTLRYASDPYGTTVNTKTVTHTIYTYALELYNSNYYDNTVPIENAKFELYKDEALTNKLGDLETDNTGYAYFLGLDAGTYYLKQVQAGNVRLKETGEIQGYRLNKESIVAKIKIDGSVPGSKDGYYLVNVRSKIAGNLPFTGSTGVCLFTGIGLLIIIGASIYYYKKEKDTH